MVHAILSEQGGVCLITAGPNVKPRFGSLFFQNHFGSEQLLRACRPSSLLRGRRAKVFLVKRESEYELEGEAD